MKKHWTEKEKVTLLDCIKLRQGNLEAAFKEAAQKLGRSVNACRYKYYSSKQKKPAIVPVTTTVSTSTAKSTRTKWTPDEDKILIAQIEANPNSRKNAFAATANITGRKVSACSHRWYNYVSLEKDTMCFATVSKTQQVNNRSRATVKAPAVSRTTIWWKKVLKLLGF